MTNFDTFTLPIPAAEKLSTPKRETDAREQAGCSGWMCSIMRDSYSTLPKARGVTKLGGLGGCPVHSWL